MKLINLILCSAFFLVTGNIYSQTFEVPQNYELKQAADYTKYEKDIIEAAKWLKETPLNEQTDKRKEVSKFVVTWVNGSPTVNVEINPTIMDFEKKNEGMLTIYMASSARFVLENNYSKDMRSKHKAALRDMISVYKSGKGIKKDKKMDKLIKSDDEGKIDEWLSENLKINNQ
ncbi:MAG TPA: hypothetical protein VIZ28_05410 [Chitinophagaceae bacterium]